MNKSERILPNIKAITTMVMVMVMVMEMVVAMATKLKQVVITTTQLHARVKLEKRL